MFKVKSACMLAIALALSASVVPSAFGDETLSLSGGDWFIHENGSGTVADARSYEADVHQVGWIPAQVPGNIQADLEAAHLLNPLWYGSGDPRLTCRSSHSTRAVRFLRRVRLPISHCWAAMQNSPGKITARN